MRFKPITMKPTYYLSFLDILFKVILAILFFKAIGTMPYSYYQLLRIAALAFFVGIIIVDILSKNYFSLPLAVLGAVIFNPFVKAVFKKQEWQLIDKYIVIALCVMIVSDVILILLRFRKNAKSIVPVILIFFSFLISSCSQKESDKTSTENKEVNFALIKKYNALTDWDSESRFSVEYQQAFDKRNIYFEGTIQDIEKKDSSFLLSIHSSIVPQDYLAKVIIDSTTCSGIINKIKKGKGKEGQFILVINKVFSTMNPSIESDTNADDDNGGTYIDFDNAVFVFKGNLIDYALNDNTDN